MPVNTAALMPAPNDRTTALTNATLTQFLSPKFGLVAGKINTLDLGETEFYGNYRTQFLNTAFNFPMTLEQLPLSTFGGGVIVLPRDDIHCRLWRSARTARRPATMWAEAFDGVMILGNGKLTVKPFGLVGHQSLGFPGTTRSGFRSTRTPPTSLARC